MLFFIEPPSNDFRFPKGGESDSNVDPVINSIEIFAHQGRAMRLLHHFGGKSARQARDGALHPLLRVCAGAKNMRVACSSTTVASAVVRGARVSVAVSPGSTLSPDAI